MPRICTVCVHANRDTIDSALVAGEPLRDIAGRFSVSRSSLDRHKAEHLPASLAKAEQAAEVASATNVMAELERCFARVNLLFDACDRWLRDPADPDRYDIGPRADDVLVIYEEPNPDKPDGRPIRSKAPLSALLPRAEQQNGVTVLRVESRHADPRELVLKAAAQLQGQTELLAKLLGELNDAPQVNVLVAPEWVAVRTTLLSALGPFPEARVAVANALQALEVSNGHRG
jgi:hypothetical protein